MRNRIVVFIPLLAVAVGCGRGPTVSKPPEVAAKIGPRTIHVAEIDEMIRPELARIEAERYEARKAKLDQVIEDALVADKAKALGVSPDELLKREVTDKTKAPTDEEVKATFDKLKAPQGATLESLSPRIRELLTSQATAARRAEFFGELRKEAGVTVALEPPRFIVDTAAGHSDGPETAPITLVEFSDYQCPFCGRSQATVGQVLSKYEGRIHHVFMDFPLSQIHPAAKPAAVASHCAEEQNKWGEYHALLFQHQRELTAENFKKWAADLGLDGAAFETCLASAKYDARIEQSLRAGQAVGVSGTPGFFVNGIAIKGAQPFEVFERTIDDELARAK
jgi:predicted DsbA family dithiol-disulfide isomerase